MVTKIALGLAAMRKTEIKWSDCDDCEVIYKHLAKYLAMFANDDHNNVALERRDDCF